MMHVNNGPPKQRLITKRGTLNCAFLLALKLLQSHKMKTSN